MKTIEYCKDGLAVADHLAESKAKEFFSSTHSSIKVSTENFILAARVLIRENFIRHTEVVFVFSGINLKPDINGKFEKWPRGFCDYTENFFARML